MHLTIDHPLAKLAEHEYTQEMNNKPYPPAPKRDNKPWKALTVVRDKIPRQKQPRVDNKITHKVGKKTHSPLYPLLGPTMDILFHSSLLLYR